MIFPKEEIVVTINYRREKELEMRQSAKAGVKFESHKNEGFIDKIEEKTFSVTKVVKFNFLALVKVLRVIFLWHIEGLAGKCLHGLISMVE